VIIAQFGESANTLVKQWKGGYRNGFPTFRAAEPPVRPMRYDQSQIYSGVIGRQYKDSTNRYMYQYDPNMYLQPGFGDFAGAAEQAAIAVFEDLANRLKPFPDNFDVVFDTSDTTGNASSVANGLMIIHGATLRALQNATATAGRVFATQTPSADLAKRIAAQRAIDPLVNATLGTVSAVRANVDSMIKALKAGTTTPLIPTPQPVPAVGATGLSRNTKIAIGVGIAAAFALGTVAALTLSRRGRDSTYAPTRPYPTYSY
jgi:hypothetical protein